MFNRISSVVASVVVGVAVLVPATASASTGGNDEVQACLSDSEGRVGGYVGVCHSYYRSSNPKAAAVAAYFCRTFFVPVGIFTTEGECVKEVAGLIILD